MDAPDMQEEYRAEVARLEWPSSATAPPGAMESAEDVEYEVGVGAASADFNWMCAWMTQWLRHREDLMAAEALDMLDQAATLPAWDMWDDSGRDAVRTAVRSARHGESADIETLRRGLGCDALFG